MSDLASKIREKSLVIHCPTVSIWQDIEVGIKLDGYGTIKINRHGVIYLEFIYLSSDNLPYNLHTQIPKDALDPKQTVFLEAIALDGSKYISKDLSIKFNLNSLHPPGVMNIILKYIEIVDNIDVSENSHLYFEFLEKCNIPANKSNSIISSLGYEEYSWNQAIIMHENIEISVVDNKEYTTISISGNFNPDILLGCIKFYIGFGDGSYVQPYLIYRINNGIKKTVINSINQEKILQRSSNPLPSSTIYSGSKTDYHYNILINIIKLRYKNPDWYNCINAHWDRVWHSFQTKNNIMSLTLSVAIEGILNDIYIPKLENNNNKELNDDIEELKKEIAKLNITTKYKDKLYSSISHFKKITAAKAMDHLVNRGIITISDKKAWIKVRNMSAHPRKKDHSIASETDERNNIFLCLNLFHSLIFNVLSYSGPRNYFSIDQGNKVIEIKYINIFNE